MLIPSMNGRNTFALILAAGILATWAGCGNPAVEFPLNDPLDSDAGLAANLTGATCSDHEKNGAETDVDCGGPQCLPCGDARTCNDPGDCASKVCVNHSCQPPTCTDMVKNGAESDVDCGGAMCPQCGNGKSCHGPLDCGTGFCKDGVCQPPTCVDMAMDGKETDVDCGGPDCSPCAVTKRCLMGSDCIEKVCTLMICAPASCFDMVKNGSETDVDCGGGSCQTCGVGKKCLVAGDCNYNVCNAGVCGCVSYYRDADLDSFGDPAVIQCVGNVAPFGYVGNNLDCDDADSRAFPGATNYYTTPRAGKGGFDFDCDNLEVKEPKLTCLSTLTGGCSMVPLTGNPGFVGNQTAGCGQQSPFCVCGYHDMSNSCANITGIGDCATGVCVGGHSEYGQVCFPVTMPCR